MLVGAGYSNHDFLSMSSGLDLEVIERRELNCVAMHYYGLLPGLDGDAVQ